MGSFLQGKWAALAAMAVAATATAASASTIFTDTLNTSTWVLGDPNQQLATRQAGGSITGVTYSATATGTNGIQTGRPNVPGMFFESITNGGEPTEDFASPNQDFNGISGPFTISFGNILCQDSAFFSEVAIMGNSTNQLTEPYTNTTALAVIFQPNGNYQIYNDGGAAPIVVGTAAAGSINSLSFNISGGNFNGSSPFTITTYINGVAVNTTTHLATDNYITFGQAGTGAIPNDTAYQNLSITQVPEPATLGMLGMGGMGLLLARRRRA